MSEGPRPRFRVVVAEIEADGRFLITQRRPEARLPLLWEFPGGRVEVGETDGEALARVLRDRLGVEIELGDRAMEVSHSYDSYTVDLRAYRVAVLGAPRPLRVHDLRWVLPEDFDRYTFPGADQATVSALLGLG
jgi:8-oxo-dGTP diphosphatase